MTTSALENGQRFGNWRFNAMQLRLDLYDGDEIDDYYVDLEEISNSANMLDWIFSAYGRPNEKENVIDLINAFQTIFQPQSNLCPSGNSRTIENVTDFLRSQINKPMKI